MRTDEKRGERMDIQWNADLINRCTLSRARLSGDDFSVQWISANEAENRNAHYRVFVPSAQDALKVKIEILKVDKQN